MKKIVLLPLDERPCNTRFAERLGEEASDVRLVLPEREVLGNKKVPPNWVRVAAYLRRECKDASALVLSIDMLLYGGLVPSRLHELSEETLSSRLSLIRELKEGNPALKIYAFALIMRCPRYSSADEEPDYYEICGKEIFLTGQAEHRFKLGLISPETYAAERKTLDERTGDYLMDYLKRREINLRLLFETVELSKDVIDRLVIPLDDSAPYGYTAMDRERLKERIGERPIELYPGADEVGMTLLARAVNEMKGSLPRVAVHYAAERGRKVIPLYEDRPLEESVRLQIAASGCIPADGAEAELQLYINVPSEDMADINSVPGAGYAERDLQTFSDQMAADVRQGRLVIAADVAYCNGGDREWVKALSDRGILFRLAGYAGWNTSSNTLGTALAQGVFRLHYGDTAAHRRFLAERYYEDVGYCGYVRALVSKEKLPPLGLDYFHADGERGRAAAIVREELERYLSELLPEVIGEYRLEKCELPWKRMFEVSLTATRRGTDKEE